MKLKGILSSKGRRAVHERNRDRKAPTDPMLSGHNPIEQPDGSLKCGGCSGIYSPLAFAAHLARKPIRDAEGMVFTLGVNDPWTAQQNPERQQQAAFDADAERRQGLIDAYFSEQRRAKARVVAGVSPSMTD